MTDTTEIKRDIIGLFVFIMVLALMFLLGADARAAGPCDGVTLDAIKAQVPLPPARIVSMRPAHGLCEVILSMAKSGENVPVYVGKDFIIAGEMFSARRQVTQEQIEKLKKAEFLKLKPRLDEAVAIDYRPSGETGRTIYMFTDPVCPFCKKAETGIKQLADEYHAELKILFFPVHIPVGRDMAVKAVCKNLDLDHYLDKTWEKDGDKVNCKKGADLLKKSSDLARRLGVRGVPCFYLDNGRSVTGAYLPGLERLLTTKVSER